MKKARLLIEERFTAITHAITPATPIEQQLEIAKVMAGIIVDLGRSIESASKCLSVTEAARRDNPDAGPDPEDIIAQLIGGKRNG